MLNLELAFLTRQVDFPAAVATELRNLVKELEYRNVIIVNDDTILVRLDLCGETVRVFACDIQVDSDLDSDDDSDVDITRIDDVEYVSAALVTLTDMINAAEYYVDVSELNDDEFQACADYAHVFGGDFERDWEYEQCRRARDSLDRLRESVEEASNILDKRPEQLSWYFDDDEETLDVDETALSLSAFLARGGEEDDYDRYLSDVADWESASADLKKANDELDDAESIVARYRDRLLYAHRYDD